MALVVEDGSGLSNADALISLVDFKASADETGRDYSSYTDTQIEQAIRRGTSFLSNSFTWAGYRTNSRNQALALPRSGMVDQEGIGIDSDEIPIEVVDACFELSWQELVDPFSLNPVFKANELVKAESIGSISVTYALASTTAQSARPELLAVRDMISQFLKQGAGSSIVGRSYRV